MEKIVICESHKNYQTPLIATMAFKYFELWCPFCGKKLGMFDGGEDVDVTPELQKRHDAYKAKYKEYLRANAVTYAHETMWQGKYISPSQLPQEEKEHLADLRKTGWAPYQQI